MKNSIIKNKEDVVPEPNFIMHYIDTEGKYLFSEPYYWTEYGTKQPHVYNKFQPYKSYDDYLKEKNTQASVDNNKEN